MKNDDRSGNIRLVSHRDIDRDKWDQCMEMADNAKVYAASWYLDITCGNWDALIWGDYEYVMPVPVKSKLIYRYVYTPYFTQSLGIFPEAPVEIQECFAVKLQENFANVRYAAGSSLSKAAFGRFRFVERHNRYLPLGRDYTDISRGYAGNVVRNTRKAFRRNVSVHACEDVEKFTAAYALYNPYKLNPDAKEVFHTLVRRSVADGSGQILMAFSEQGEILAGSYVLTYKERFYYLGSFSSPLGLKRSASFAVVDEFCRRNSGTCRILDFEGSEIEGIDSFFGGFGAVRENYYVLEYNRLPPVVMWLKEKLTRK